MRNLLFALALFPLTSSALGCHSTSSASGACTSGHCVTTLAQASPGGPYVLAVDSTNVYWADALQPELESDGGYSGPVVSAIHKVPLAGGAVTTLASGLTELSSMALDSTTLYFPGALGVMTVPIAGGSVSALPSSGWIDAVYAVRDGVLYGNDGTHGTLATLPVTGGPPTDLADPLAGGASTACEIAGVAVAAQGFVWSESCFQETLTGFLGLDPADGGAVALLGGTVTGTRFMATDDMNVYYADGVPDAAPYIDTDGVSVPTTFPAVLRRLPLDGGAAATVATGLLAANLLGFDLDIDLPIAVDATSVYWASSVANSCENGAASGPDADAGCSMTVSRAPIAGGAPELLATFDQQVQQIAVDDSSVYVIVGPTYYYAVPNPAPAYVMRISPK